MHDRHRYEDSYVRTMEALACRHAHVMLKFKSDSPDSLVDVLVSDVMMSNYSSFLNAFYYTGRPTIHIDPTAGISGGHVARVMKRGRLRLREVEDPLSTWKLSPDDIGGLRAKSFDELLAAVDRSLADPTCCRELAQSFIARHITQADGTTCARIGRYLQEWAGE